MSLKEKKFNYFDAFSRMAEKSSQAAKMLITVMSDFDPAQVQQMMTDMHTIEHQADQVHHEIIQHLAKEFVVPIEREDIILMAREMDEVTDCIEDVIQRMYMYNIKTIPDNAARIAVVIGKCCDELIVSLSRFEEFRKTVTVLKESIIEINILEEEGDRLYIDGIRELFEKGGDAAHIVAWESTYTRLEKCCDACEHVADVIESIIMKNS